MDTKASRLNRLFNTEFAPYLLPQTVLSREMMQNESTFSLIQKVEREVGNVKLAVRSSSFDEDQDFTQAGKYLSLLDIELNDLVAAANRVLDSYESKDLKDHVLVQPFIANSQVSGVIFSHDPRSGSPYITINYHEGTDTTNVTSGKGDNSTVVGFRKAPNLSEAINPHSSLINSLIDFYSVPVDIEFLIVNDNFYILQVRALKLSRTNLNVLRTGRFLEAAKDKLLPIMKPHPYLVGDRTIFGVMPDWNPAELIGTRPTKISIDLFRELITDNIWAYERSNLGYRNTRSFPLLIDIVGHPYIDLRVSINSLLPADLEERLQGKLANLYLDYLEANPHLHDKVEFSVYLAQWTCTYSSDIRRYAHELSATEIDEVERCLLRLTRYMIESSTLDSYEAKITNLSNRYKKIEQSQISFEQKIFWLVEDCKRFGTLPFAGIARMAFVATALLRSLVEVDFLREDELQRLHSSIETPAISLYRDLGRLDEHDFFEEYGHLRPGTFDMRVPNYAKARGIYLRSIDETRARGLTQQALTKVKNIDTTNFHRVIPKLNLTVSEVVDWSVKAIALREKAKFCFSRNISSVLEQIAEFGERIGVGRTQMAHANLSWFLRRENREYHSQETLSMMIEENEQKYEETLSVWLPPLIFSVNNLYEFRVMSVQANFIGERSVTGDIASPRDHHLEGKIVCIEFADPGFDWIFAHSILGLITCYGGANSHMAVRAKEMGIAAAIGVGEEMFHKLEGSSVVFLDCLNNRIEIVS